MITIPRYCKKQLKNVPTDMKLHSDATILIQDHLDDSIVAFIQLNGKKKDNEFLADKIIEAIEEFIEEYED